MEINARFGCFIWRNLVLPTKPFGDESSCMLYYIYVYLPVNHLECLTTYRVKSITTHWHVLVVLSASKHVGVNLRISRSTCEI